MNGLERLKKLYQEAEESGEPVSIGDLVICDICSKDYTDSPAKGGFIFAGKAYCPDCASKSIGNIRQYKEEKYIQACCADGVTFADFVRDFRGENNTIQVTKF